MDYTVDMSCVMKVNRNCDFCRQKVSHVMASLNAFYCADFVGDNNTITVKGRANPNIILAVFEMYGEHGKVSNLRFDGEVMTSRPGGGYNGPSGYYLPSKATAGNNYPYNAVPSYSYPSYYPPAPPPPMFFAGIPMFNPPKQTEATKVVKSQHTQPPAYTHPPPAPRPLHSYSYIEPPYWPTESGRKCCVIM